MTSSNAWDVAGAVAFFVLASLAGTYFAFAAVHGDYGRVRRAEVDHQSQQLAVELARMDNQVSQLENRTRRLSDTYLDLELLDQQARAILGYSGPRDLVVDH